MTPTSSVEHTLDAVVAAEEARHCRKLDQSFATWAAGYGPIAHEDLTQWRMYQVIERLRRAGITGDGVDAWELLHAADRIACAGMWLAAHQTYAQNVYLDGRALSAGDFKPTPEGHLGGALNMVVAYVGYLAANALTGHTRSWVMGQGHCVAGIDSVNLLVGNLSPQHQERYSVSNEGLSRYVRDFYSYRLNARGRQDSPLGSHVNAHTAGGISEGGYLGFTELQYVHMPLPGERLVTFLSDGAFEEQRGSDWAPRFWRPDDCGLVAPIMIANGRRIDQRTTMAQSGGIEWFVQHLNINGFDPIVFDGRDPAAFVWTILEIELRELAIGRAWKKNPNPPYTSRLPYGIAVTTKGWGFFGAGTLLAHNLPLPGSPHSEPAATKAFNESAEKLWVPPDELEIARNRLGQHAGSSRPRERDHALATRSVKLEHPGTVEKKPVKSEHTRIDQLSSSSPMTAIDDGFVSAVERNPHLRPRVGNPDEMRSNRLLRTLDRLKFRVTDPESNVPESVHGAVVTALNEEAVVCAAIGNKGGINLVCTYEAFAPKMLGALRQELIFTEHLLDVGRPVGFLSLPLVLTSHTWENAKNEQSHQDPTCAEALLGELSHLSRVLFPADFNSAGVLIEQVYRTQGQIWTLVVPKGKVADIFSADDAQELLRDGALELRRWGHRPEQARAILVAIGAYQLMQVCRASERLTQRGAAHRVVYMLEPGRFRQPRNEREAAHVTSEAKRSQLFPTATRARVFLTHTRPEPMLGLLRPLHTGESTAGLGFSGLGGTLTTEGLLFVNRCSWAHVLREYARVTGSHEEELLSREEIAALNGQQNPEGVIVRAG